VARSDASSGDDYRLVSPVFHDGSARDTIEGFTGTGLEVTVIFTDGRGTLAALQRADRLAPQLEAYIRLLMAYEVPYALPLTRPAVPVQFLEGQIRDLVGKTRLQVAAHICLCRDKRRALELLLRPHSLVVMGGERHWWLSSARKLARTLEKNGHEVIFAELR
jgi:hypothetical protein